jgi:hypothetical protein
MPLVLFLRPVGVIGAARPMATADH